MKKEKKMLLISIIFAIVYIFASYFLSKYITIEEYDNVDEKLMLASDIINYLIYGIGLIYLSILTFNKKIDLNNHSKGILGWSIYFFICNIVTGIIGFIIYSRLDKNTRKVKRELPKIEYKQYTNKYLSLLSLIICLVFMFVISDYINSFIGMIGIYIVIFTLMILNFYKQLVYDFKLFKEYFKEYISLVISTWLKSMVVMFIFSLVLQIVTGNTTSNNQQALQDMFGVYPLFVAILSMFYAPFAEELMFRGVIRKFFKNKYVFIIVSGVLFGLLHVIDDSKTIAEFSYVIVYSSLGMFLASLYYKTNNLFTNISFHFIQNTLGVIGMILLYFLG